MEEKIKQLWIAANVHSVTICGDFLSENEVGENGVPLQPSDDEVLDAAIEYLNGSI